MIDLHCHTVCSDGWFTPIEILQKAEEEGLEYLSITDHDRVKAYNELLNIDTKKYFSGKIILGSEIRFVHKKMQFELLAYGYDFEKLKNNYWVSEDNYTNLKKASLVSMLQTAKDVGFVYNTVLYDQNVKPERLFYEELKKHEENEEIFKKFKVNHSGDFYRNMLAEPTSPMFFDSTEYSLSLDEAIELIHSCGGIAVLAHPFGVYNIENPKEIIEEIISHGIDGIECMHANVKKEQTQYLLELCKKYNLVSTGGSDYHGYEGQVFARANFRQDKIPTSLISKLLEKINTKNIIG